MVPEPRNHDRRLAKFMFANVGFDFFSQLKKRKLYFMAFFDKALIYLPAFPQ